MTSRRNFLVYFIFLLNGLLCFSVFAQTSLIPVKYKDYQWPEQSAEDVHKSNCETLPKEIKTDGLKTDSALRDEGLGYYKPLVLELASNNTATIKEGKGQYNPAQAHRPEENNQNRADGLRILHRLVTYEMNNTFATAWEGQEGSWYYKMVFESEEAIMNHGFIQIPLRPNQEVLQVDFRIKKADGRNIDVPANYLKRYEQLWLASTGNIMGYQWAIPLIQPRDTVEIAYRLRGLPMPSMFSFGHPDWAIEYSEFRLICLTKFDVVWSMRRGTAKIRCFEEYYKEHVYFTLENVAPGQVGYDAPHIELGEVPRWISEGGLPKSWSAFYLQLDAFQEQSNRKYYKLYERHWQRWWRSEHVRDNWGRLMAFHRYFSDSLRSVNSVQIFNPDVIIERHEVGAFSAWVLYDEMIRRLGFEARFVLARTAERGLFDDQMLSASHFDVAFFLVEGPAGELAVLVPPQRAESFREMRLPRLLDGGSGVMIPCYQPEHTEVVRFVHP